MNKINDYQIYNKYAKCLWNYHKLDQKISKSDIIFGFGSHDLNVAKRCAQLYLNDYADLIIFSGGYGRITKNLWNKTEAEKFAQIAIDLGVPKEKILIEPSSTNTGENISFAKKMLSANNLNPKNFIFVDKPYRERRTFATLKKQWADINFSITSPNYSYEEYLDFYNGNTLNKKIESSILNPDKSSDMSITDSNTSSDISSDLSKDMSIEILESLNKISPEEFISIMVGDLQRIKLYSDLGFQIEQTIPEDVYFAYKKLIKLGFDKHLLK